MTKLITETQKKIIKNRENLEMVFRYFIDGTELVDGVDIKRTGDIEKVLQDCMAFFIDETSRLRKSQQETFDKHPTFAATCIRV